MHVIPRPTGPVCAGVRSAALLLAAVSGGLALVPTGAAAGPLPNPCQVVSGPTIAAAFGITSAPPSTLTAITQSQTCSYRGGKLTISVGYTAIGNPAFPKTLMNVPGLPHGKFATYAGSTQTQVSFYKGSAATGIYGTVRNTGKISKAHLEAIALALYQGIES